MPGTTIATLDDLMASNVAVVTVTEAASILRLDPRTVRQGVADGTVKGHRFGSKVLIPRPEILRLISV